MCSAPDRGDARVPARAAAHRRRRSPPVFARDRGRHRPRAHQEPRRGRARVDRDGRRAPRRARGRAEPRASRSRAAARTTARFRRPRARAVDLRGQRAARDGATPRTRASRSSGSPSPRPGRRRHGRERLRQVDDLALLSPCARDERLGAETPTRARVRAPRSTRASRSRAATRRAVPDGDVVELTQTTYCPLYTTPLEWLAQPSLDYWLALGRRRRRRCPVPRTRAARRDALGGDARRSSSRRSRSSPPSSTFGPAATLAVEERCAPRPRHAAARRARGSKRRRPRAGGRRRGRGGRGRTAPPRTAPPRSSCPRARAKRRARRRRTCATSSTSRRRTGTPSFRAASAPRPSSSAKSLCGGRRARDALVDEALAPLDPTSRATVQARLRAFCAARGSLVLVIHHDDDADDGSADRPGLRRLERRLLPRRLQFANGTAELVGRDSRARA